MWTLSESPLRRYALVPALSVVILTTIGCTQAPAGLEKGSIRHDGLSRSYLIAIPDTAPAETPLPLVLALHRFAGSAAEMARISRFHEVGIEEGFIVCYPDGRGRRWNTDPDARPDDVGYLRALVAALAAEYPVDLDRVYVTGASNGGFLSWLLACEAADTFAAVAPVMATLPENIATACASAAMPICVVHGTDDPVVPYDGFELGGGPAASRGVLPIPEAVAFWVTRNGADTAPVIEVLSNPDPRDPTVTVSERYLNPGGAEVLLYRVEGGGHTWPGGGEIWPRFIVGPQSTGFDASRAIWEFFRNYTRSETGGQRD